MNTVKFLGGAFVALLWAHGSQLAHADTTGCSYDPSRVVCTAHGGGDPLPFDDANQKVELASGETYQLYGWIEVEAGIPFFKVDFCAHPWLSSKIRMANPSYPIIENGSSDWSGFAGRKVRMAFVAKGRVETVGAGSRKHYDYVMGLEPVPTTW